MVSNRDLLSPEELRAIGRKLADQGNRAFTWHNLSLLAAKVTLGVFFVIWLGTFYWMIEPSISIFEPPRELFYNLLSLVVCLGLAFACTVVPPIFWSSLIAQTPASELMNRLYAKYGRSGFYIACLGAVAFTIMGFNSFLSFWLSRPHVAEGGSFNLYFWAGISVFLAVVFPAWALNKTTPEQWIAGMIQAREVARLQHALALEETIGHAMILRADSLLHMDLLSMTAEEQATHNRELAALIATAERRINKSLSRIGHTFSALHGISLDIQTDRDDRIVDGYRRLAALLGDAGELTGERADQYEQYVKSLPEVAPAPALPPREPERVTGKPSATRIADGPTIPMEEGSKQVLGDLLGVTVSQSNSHGPSVTVSDHHEEDNRGDPDFPDKYLVCREILTIPFNVQELAHAANVAYSTADRYRKIWLESGHIERTGVTGKYFWSGK